MRTRILFGIGLLFFAAASAGRAQDTVWRPVGATTSNPVVTLGQPTPLGALSPCEPHPRVVRAQAPDGPPPPPPPFPGGGPTVYPTPPAEGGRLFNTGAINNDSDLGTFWVRVGDKFKRCWDDVSGGAAGAFQSTPGRKVFQSDHCFDVFASPVTTPFFF